MAHDTRLKGEFVARRPKSERRRIIIGWTIAIAVIACIAGIVYGVGFSNVSKVRGVLVIGNRIVGSDEIARAVSGALASRSWISRAVGEGNIVFWMFAKEMPGETINEPAIKSLVVHVDLIGRRVIIEVREREFIGVWCADTCVGFDDRGIAYFDAPSIEGSLFLEIQDVGGSAPKFGERVLGDEQQFNNMLATIQGVRDAGIAITHVTVKDHNLREWSITPSHGGELLFSFDVVPERIASILKNIMERTKWDGLSYVDFRVVNRVYYK